MSDLEPIPIAILGFSRDGQVRFCWEAHFFMLPEPIPPELRAQIVRLLRFHADKLESGETDERMHGLAPSVLSGGEA